jgi:hypothetical protein
MRGDAAEDIAAADDDGDFGVEFDDLGDFGSEAFEDGRLDAVALLTGQHLSTDLEEDAPVFCRAHASPS